MFEALQQRAKGLPLPLRMAYGWLKRRLRANPLWTDPKFQRMYQWLMKTQWWSKVELEGLQGAMLQELIKHAYENTPYYHRLLDDNHLTPNDIRGPADLQKLPILTRDQVRDNMGDMVARNLDPSHLLFRTTGGTTGAPLGIYYDARSVSAHESAFRLRQWTWAGYRPGDRVLSLRAHYPRQVPGCGTVHWDYDTIENQLQLSMLDTSADTLDQYIGLANQFAPSYIIAQPSALAILVQHVRRERIDSPAAQAVFFESETVWPAFRELAEAQFSCPVFAAYGDTERVVDAVECPAHVGYHLCMEYGVLELVDDQGELITEPGAWGNVVATGLDTYSMPMIRYAKDDQAMYARAPCPCGRQHTLLSHVTGTSRQYLVTSDGGVVPLALGHYPVWSQVRELQVVQKQAGELVFSLSLAEGGSKAKVERGVMQALAERFGSEAFRVRFQYVDAVPRTRRGKIKVLDQHLPITLTDLPRVETEERVMPQSPVRGDS